MSKSPDAFRTISEVADWLDTPAHVLRFWESRFTQVKPVKRAGGRRYYRPADMALLGGIKKLLHDDGMTIRGVQKLLREHGVRYVAAMSPEIEGVDPIPAPDVPNTPIPPAPMAVNVPQEMPTAADPVETVVPFNRPSPRKPAAPDPGQTTFDFAPDVTPPAEAEYPMAPVEEIKAPGEVDQPAEADAPDQPDHEDFAPENLPLQSDVAADNFYDSQHAPTPDAALGADLDLPDDPQNDAEEFAPSILPMAGIERRGLAQLPPETLAAVLTRAEALHTRLTATV